MQTRLHPPGSRHNPSSRRQSSRRSGSLLARSYKLQSDNWAQSRQVGPSLCEASRSTRRPWPPRYCRLRLSSARPSSFRTLTSSSILLDQALKVFNSRSAYNPERTRTLFKKSVFYAATGNEARAKEMSSNARILLGGNADIQKLHYRSPTRGL